MVLALWVSHGWNTGVVLYLFDYHRAECERTVFMVVSLVDSFFGRLALL